MKHEEVRSDRAIYLYSNDDDGDDSNNTKIMTQMDTSLYNIGEEGL